jgi:hypothetical protein
MVSTPEERILLLERRVESQLALIDSQQTQLDELRASRGALDAENARLRLEVAMLRRDGAKLVPPLSVTICHAETGEVLYSTEANA